MKPLDLRTTPPRPPRAELAGLIFLPRTIDKARASLPGGNLGEYVINGFSKMMLDKLGITDEDFIIRVGAAASDEDIAAFVRSVATPESMSAWNEYARVREPGGGDRATALMRYPWLNERPDLILALDILEEDDRRLFNAP